MFGFKRKKKGLILTEKTFQRNFSVPNEKTQEYFKNKGEYFKNIGESGVNAFNEQKTRHENSFPNTEYSYTNHTDSYYQKAGFQYEKGGIYYKKGEKIIAGETEVPQIVGKPNLDKLHGYGGMIIGPEDDDDPLNLDKYINEYPININEYPINFENRKAGEYYGNFKDGKLDEGVFRPKGEKKFYKVHQGKITEMRHQYSNILVEPKEGVEDDIKGQNLESYKKDIHFPHRPKSKAAELLGTSDQELKNMQDSKVSSVNKTKNMQVSGISEEESASNTVANHIENTSNLSSDESTFVGNYGSIESKISDLTDNNSYASSFMEEAGYLV